MQSNANLINTNGMNGQSATSGTNIALFVGPYKLEKTLGKGQTGLVKLGIHHKTGKKVAIKIVNREKLNESVLMKVEREITIMKLIEHPHVLKLYDVYENKKYLYLILEHVSGGELFDYLVKKSRLTIKEARKFFKQIISALDFCHSHLICHRDLKPENLLLDDKLNIKIADFGMASLQVDGSMLETSCGSPHYACPEVIRGEKYDGRKADIWSCGVILYALLVGALPFDDDNLKHLLEKIKKGHFQVPAYVPNDCQDLLRSMVEVDPNKRITIEGIYKHHWFLAGITKDELELEQPLCQITPTAIIPSINDIDTDLLSHMTSLGSFKDKQKLIENLLNDKHNTEKVIYFLLLERKLKQPSNDDEDDLSTLRFRNIDAPRKRVDRFKIPYDVLYSKLTVGSPIINRRSNVFINGSSGQPQARYQSCHTTPIGSPCTSPMIMNKDLKMHNFGNNNNNNSQSAADASPSVHRGALNLSACNTPNSGGDNLSVSSQASANTLRSRINSLKKNIQLPKFSRRKVTPEKVNLEVSVQNCSSGISKTPDAQSAARSWFQRWSSNGSALNVDKEKSQELVFTLSDRPLNNIKALLIHSFLSIKNLLHNLHTTNSFACDYRLSERTALSCVRFMVDIQIDSSAILKQIESKSHAQYPTYKITFQFLSGSRDEFKQLYKQIYTFVMKNGYGQAKRDYGGKVAQSEECSSGNVSTFKTVMHIPVASHPITITNSPQFNKILQPITQKIECSPNKSNFINYSTLYTTNLH